MHDKRWEHWEKINLVDNEKNDKELHKEVQGKSNLPASPPQLKKPKSLLNTVLQLRSSQSMLLCFNA